MSNLRAWVQAAVKKIDADYNRSADTHLIRLEVPGTPNVHLYCKDESTHPTGSLKHRLARSLFLYALCNGWLHEGTPVIEASSGSTAISEAYFARLLGLPFIAVMPMGTSAAKIGAIEFYGGRCHLVDDPGAIYSEAHRLAGELNGHFMDQFTYAERVTDWRGNNNIAESIFEQMRDEPHPEPSWVVCGAGTGGTSATIGRYVRYLKLDTQICVVDPENSVFFEYYHSGDADLSLSRRFGRGGDRATACRAVVYPPGGGSDDLRPQCSHLCSDSSFGADLGAQVRRLHWLQSLWSISDHGRDARASGGRVCGHADLRCR